MTNILNDPKIKHIHMIGIGGISMSGLSSILLNLGYSISGSDAKPSSITEKLQSQGIKFYQGHSPENVSQADLIVYTSAIKKDNPEYMRAKDLGIPTIDRATLLGYIMEMYPYSIAISGTHGKTTTTSMISVIMLEAETNPTIHIGGEFDFIGGNTKIGNSRYFITEACEYMENFLKFHPYIAIVLNIEEDHLDYYRDINHIKDAFLKFASQISPEGFLVACSDDDNASWLVDNVERKTITYGINDKNAAWKAENINYDHLGCAGFDIYYNGNFFASIQLSVPGQHNIYNALASAAACSALGIAKEYIKEGLQKFTGTHRRFESKGIKDGIRVVDDYAHHPSEIKATLSAAKKTSHNKIWCIFQPHTYTRTLALLDEFSSAFKDADKIIVTDIYAAREKDNGKINSGMLAEKICESGSDCIYLPSFASVVEHLRSNAVEGDLILTVGAGDIYKVGEMFLA